MADIFDENSSDAIQGGIFDDMMQSTTKVLNASEIESQAAYVEATATGRPYEDVLEENRTVSNVTSVEDVKEKAVSSATDVAKTEAKGSLAEYLASGDKEAAKEAIDFINDEKPMEFEEAVVANVTTPQASENDMYRAYSNMAVRNKMEEIMTELDEKSGFWSRIANIGSATFLPGHDNAVMNDIINEKLGKEYEGFLDNRVGSIQALNELRDSFNGLDPDEKVKFLDDLKAIAEEESGVFGENYSEMYDFFNKFMEADAADATIDNAFAAVDATIVLAPFMKGFGILRKGASTARVASTVGNTEAAAGSVARDILEGEGVSGIPSPELINKALSFGKNPYTVDGMILEGASDEVKRQLSAQAASKEISELMKVTGPTGIPQSEVDMIAKKYRDFYENAKAPFIKEAEFVDADDIGANFNVRFQDPSLEAPFPSPESAEKFAKKMGMKDYKIESEVNGPWVDYFVSGRYTHKFTVDDVTGYNLEEVVSGDLVHALPNFIQFPMQSGAKESVFTRVLGVNQEDAMRHNFSKAYEKSIKGLNAKSESKVFEMLKKGDAYSDYGDEGKVFSPHELTAYGLSDQEQAAYYKIRTLRDTAWVVHNKALKDRLDFLGYRQLDVKGTNAVDELTTAGKVYSQKEAQALAKDGRIIVYDTSRMADNAVEASADDLARLYENGGNRLVKLASPEKFDGVQYDLMLVKEDNLSEKALDIVLPYRKGEFSRMYTDKYFVYETAKGVKNGKPTTYQRTIKTSGTKEEAKRWADAHNTALKKIRDVESEGVINGFVKGTTGYVQHLARHVYDDLADYDDASDFVKSVLDGDISMDTNFGVKFDREVPLSTGTDNSIEALFAHGRLFTGSRNERLTRVTGEPAPIKGVKEAFANELSHISRYANAATWRDSQVQAILKTFEGRLVGQRGDTPYEIAFKGELKGDWTPAETKYLERLRQHVKTQIGVPSDEAINARAKMVHFAEWLQGRGKVGRKASEKVLSFESRTPSELARTMVFHSYLGLFNFAQLLVQANGSVIAAAVHPIHGAKAAASFPLYRMGVLLDSIDNKKGLEFLAKSADFSSLGISNKKEFMDTIELIRKSGVLNSIKSSALHYVKEGAVDLESDAVAFTQGLYGGLKSTGRKVTRAGLVPFNRGEEFTRMVALDIAKREWVKLNPGKSFTTRSAVNEILAMQEKLTLGMSRANVGRIQQGWAATPFQFAQYSWKLAESLLGKSAGFTAAEKARIVTAMALLYGPENMGPEYLSNELMGDTLQDMDKGTRIAWTQGGISWALYATTGAETAVGTRVSPMGYFKDLTDGMFSGDLSALDFFTGPSGSFLSKELDMVKDLTRIFSTTDNLTAEEAKQGLYTALSGMSSGFSNTTKYMMAMYGDNYIRSKSGSKIAPVNNLEAILGIFGFTSLKEAEAWKARELQADLKKEKSEMAQALSKIWNAYYSAMARGDKAEAESKYKQAIAFKSSLPPEIAYDVSRMAGNFVNREDMYSAVMRETARAVEKGQIKTTTPSIQDKVFTKEDE